MLAGACGASCGPQPPCGSLPVPWPADGLRVRLGRECTCSECSFAGGSRSCVEAGAEPCARGISSIAGGHCQLPFCLFLCFGFLYLFWLPL